MKTNSLDFDAQALREKILDLAMRGKLVKQDPNDEPASVLLEKIKAEKEELVKEKKIKKSKPLPEITDDEKPFDIPDSWEWVRLGEICLSNIGLTYKPSQKSEKPTKTIILRANNIEANELNKENMVFLDIDNLAEKYYLKENDILMAVRSGSKRLVGKSAVVTSQFIGLSFGAFMSKIRILDANSWYVDYFLNSTFFRNQLGDANTTTINQITQRMINNFVLPIPPLEEQSRIAAKIAQLFALLRKVESSNQQYAKLQTLLKSKVLDLAMRGKLVEQDPNDEPASVLLEKIKAEKAELVKEKKIKKSKPLPEIADDEKPFDIPDSWEWVHVKDITTIGNFKSISPQNINQGENLIELADIESNTGRLLNFEKVTSKVGSNKYRYNQGDVLFAKLRPYLRKVLIAPNNGICTTELLPISGIQANNTYIYYIFLSDLFFGQISQEMHGVNLPRISPKKLSELIIPLPPIKEQTRIVSKLRQLFKNWGAL